MPAVQLVGLHGLLSIPRRLHREEKRSGRIAVGKGLGLLHRGVARLSPNGKGHEVAAGLGKCKECGPGVDSTTKGGRTAGAVGQRRRRGGGVKQKRTTTCIASNKTTMTMPQDNRLASNSL